MIPALILTLICATLCGLTGVKLHQDRLRQRELVARLRKSEIYGHLYPELLRARKRPVETVSIHPEGMSLRFLIPMGDVFTCSFDALGFDPMEQVPLYALAQAVAVDLPCLRDNAAYTFITHREKRPDGQIWRWYEYAIRTDAKDEQMRGYNAVPPTQDVL